MLTPSALRTIVASYNIRHDKHLELTDQQLADLAELISIMQPSDDAILYHAIRLTDR